MKRRIVDILFENSLCFKDEKGYFMRYRYKSMPAYLKQKENGLIKDNETVVKYLNETLMIDERYVKTPLSSLGRKVFLNIQLLPDYEDNDFCNERQGCSDLDMFTSVLMRLAHDNLKPKSDVHIWFEHRVEDGKDIVLKRCMCLI